MIKKSSKCLIYGRCSTDESRQDVQNQLQQLRGWCDNQGLFYEECFDYGSGFKGDQPNLKEKLEQIRLGHYQILIVWDMSRFSREHPRKVDELLNKIVYDYKCRFLSLNDGIDSSDEVKWHIMRHMMTYFANVYSRKLSERVKEGIQRKKENGTYKGGRPKKIDKVDVDEVKRIYDETKSLRKTAKLYNESRYKNNRISYQYVSGILDDKV